MTFIVSYTFNGKPVELRYRTRDDALAVSEFLTWGGLDNVVRAA